MVNYMVAIDGSLHGDKAFQWALQTMNHQVDHLFLLIVAERISHAFLTAGLSYGYIMSAQEEIQREAKRVLLKYARQARKLKLKVTPLISTSHNAGEAICTAAKLKEIDYLVVGPRGHGKVATFLLGSVSKYCVENAHCNVIVAKLVAPPSEIHTNLEEVRRLEEEERKRRVAEDKAVAADEQRAHALDKNITIIAEEQERWRRIHEAEALSNDEVDQRVLAAKKFAELNKQIHKHVHADKTGIAHPSEGLAHPSDEKHRVIIYEMIS